MKFCYTVPDQESNQMARFVSAVLPIFCPLVDLHVRLLCS